MAGMAGDGIVPRFGWEAFFLQKCSVVLRTTALFQLRQSCQGLKVKTSSFGLTFRGNEVQPTDTCIGLQQSPKVSQLESGRRSYEPHRPGRYP